MGVLAALEIWDDESLHDLAARHVDPARSNGGTPAVRLALDGSSTLTTS